MNKLRKWPGIWELVDELRAQYYPDVHQLWAIWERKQRRTSYPLSRPEVTCKYPAVYVESFSVRVYRVTKLDGTDAEPEVLNTDKSTSVARYQCPQCHSSYETLKDFRAHIGREGT